MNYYEQTLQKIDQLIEEAKYDEALVLLKEELSMPYIPAQFETRLKAYYSEIMQITNQESPSNLTGQQIFALLNDPQLKSDEKIGLFQKLEMVNLRSFYPEITSFLNSSIDSELKTILIYLLANQEVDHEFSWQGIFQKNTINPKTFDFKTAELIPLQLIEKLEAILPQDYVQLLEMGKVVVANIYYKLFPLTTSYDWDKMSQAIKNRLLLVNGIENDQKTAKDEQVLQYEKMLVDLQII